MRRTKRMREAMVDLCGQLHPDDGACPRDFQRGRASRDYAGRKARQLCRQVADVLSYVLAGESADEVLQNLLVLSVDPAPSTSRLLVTVQPDAAAETVGVAEVLARLYRAAGWLRREVAASIHRKRTPELAFRVAAPTGGSLPAEER